MVSVGDSSSFRGGEFIGLLLSGYRAYFGGQWKAGEWSRSVLLAAVPVVAGRSGSKVTGARGASPADGLPAVASSRRSRRVFLAALFKASQRRGSGGPWIRGD